MTTKLAHIAFAVVSFYCFFLTEGSEVVENSQHKKVRKKMVSDRYESYLPQVAEDVT